MDVADIGTEANGGAHSLAGWSPKSCSDEPGGNYGSIATDPSSPDNRCRLVWWKDDDNPTATLSLDSGGSKARHIELRVLDSIADDSFDVYVLNPGGNWALVYSYSDQLTTETWLTHHIYSFPAGKGQGSTVQIKIVATGPKWFGFDTWGQLAVDYVKLFDH